MDDAQGRVLWSGQRAALVAEQLRLSSIISHQWHPRSLLQQSVGVDDLISHKIVGEVYYIRQYTVWLCALGH
jgi:hypothetical protein